MYPAHGGRATVSWRQHSSALHRLAAPSPTLRPARRTSLRGLKKNSPARTLPAFHAPQLESRSGPDYIDVPRFTTGVAVSFTEGRAMHSSSHFATFGNSRIGAPRSL